MHEALAIVGVITAEEAAREDGWSAWLGALARDGRATCLVVDRAPAGLWVAAESLAMLLAVHADATLHPPIVLPDRAEADSPDPSSAHGAPADARAPEREAALRELLRARLGALGPVTAGALAAPLGLALEEIEPALLQLQAEGSVLQGRFSGSAHEPGAPIEWCERHLLARIHRYTLGRLRREIEPVEPRDVARFLFEWQHVASDSRVSGPEALAGVLAQLEGYEAPAAAWEAELLPARMTDYAAPWLDELCTAGRTLWTRLRPAADGRAGAGTSLRATPILLLPRRTAPTWAALVATAAGDETLGSRARRVAEFLSTHGASFFDDIAAGAHLLGTELEDALAQLVVRGRVHCDSYAGLRALLVPPSRRAASSSGRRRRSAWLGIQDAGRWSLVRGREAAGTSPSPESLEHVARTLLKRYGVVCWRLLEREPAWIPPWRDLVRVYRRRTCRSKAIASGSAYCSPDSPAMKRPPIRLTCSAR